MRTIIVTDRQSIIDLAVQYYGSSAAVIDLCQDNDLELDSEVVPGQQLLIQDTYPDTANGDVADYIASADIQVVGTYYNPDLGEDFIITNDGDFLTTNSGYYIIYEEAA